MSATLADTLNQLNADHDAVQQALRLYLSEQTGDKTPKELLAELRAAATDPKELDHELERLQKNPAELDQAALLSLSAAWEDPAARPSVEESLSHAKESLPVIELGILAIVAMYGMYRAIPAQPVKVTTIIERDKNGKYKQKKVTEHERFLPIASAVAKLFRGR
jgi:hypothetical protein